MSEFGFRVENNNGQVLIDDFNDMYRLLEEGETYLSDSGHWITNSAASFNHSIPKDEPVICVFRLDITGISFPYLATDGSGNKTGVYLNEENPQGGIPYKLFVRYGWNPEPVTDADYGLVVYGPSGNILYDSRIATLKVIDVVNIGHPDWESQLTAYHESAPSTYYDVFSLDHIYREYWISKYTYGGMRLEWNYYKQTSSTTLECVYRHEDYPLRPEAPREDGITMSLRGDGRCLVLDDNLYY